MKNLRLRRKVARSLDGSSRGVTLIEVLIALALFTIIAIVFISGLTVAARSVFIGDQRTTAESLARTQLEFVKSQDYINYSKPKAERNPIRYQVIAPDPSNYSIEVEVQPIDADGVPFACEDELCVSDEGLQKITVTVSRDGQRVFALEGYNMDR